MIIALLIMTAIAVILAFLPKIGPQEKTKWQPPYLLAILMSFTLGSVFPYVIGETRNYPQAFFVGILAIPTLTMLSAYVRWRFILPFYSRTWLKLKNRARTSSQ